jgi:nitrate/TMAO reductase-like tetraheme cytochrome c subunit
MGRLLALSVTFLIFLAAVLGLSGQEQVEILLAQFEPENHRYAQAEACVNCHQSENDIMTRAVGVDISSGSPALDERGWLASVHSRSQSHDYRVNTACAWCHAPTVEGATQDSLAAVPIEPGTWEGVTCGACHPGRLEGNMRESLLINFSPGSDPTDPASYVFIDRADPLQVNAQCRYCHHEFHPILSEAKAELLETGTLRCIDCHMAGYGVSEDQIVERFHNMKVEANGPLSCSGEYGTETGCHANASAEWMHTAIPNIKGPRAEW